MDGGDPAAFHWHCRVTVVVEPALQFVGRSGHRCVDIAFAHRKCAKQIGPQVLVDQRRVGSECCLGADDRRERIEVEPHQFRRVFCCIAAVRNDDRDRLADMPHFVVCQPGLLRVVELVLDSGRPFARQ